MFYLQQECCPPEVCKCSVCSTLCMSDQVQYSMTYHLYHWTLGTGHWTLNTGHWILYTGHWELDTGHWTHTLKPTHAHLTLHRPHNQLMSIGHPPSDHPQQVRAGPLYNSLHLLHFNKLCFIMKFTVHGTSPISRAQLFVHLQQVR